MAGSRLLGTNPRAKGTNPRAVGTNPRAVEAQLSLKLARREDGVKQHRVGGIPVRGGGTTTLRRMRIAAWEKDFPDVDVYGLVRGYRDRLVKGERFGDLPRTADGHAEVVFGLLLKLDQPVGRKSILRGYCEASGLLDADKLLAAYLADKHEAFGVEEYRALNAAAVIGITDLAEMMGEKPEEVWTWLWGDLLGEYGHEIQPEAQEAA